MNDVLNISQMNSNPTMHNIIHWLIQTVILSCITISLIADNESIMIIAGVLSIIYVAVSDLSSCLLLLISITIFENAFTISGIHLWIILLFILCCKCILKERNILHKDGKTILAFLVLFLIELLTDIINTGANGLTLSVLLLIAFVFLTCPIKRQTIEANNPTRQTDGIFVFDNKRFLIHFGTGYILMIFFLLYEYGGISGFIDEFFELSQNTSADYYRFGKEYAGKTGGAMSIPLYSLLLIAFSLIHLLKTKDKREVFLNTYCVFILVLSLFFGALTVSRSFYAGLFPIIILLPFTKDFIRIHLGKRIFIFFIVSFVLLFVFQKQQDLFRQLVDNLFDRASADTTGGRDLIWRDCFDYLSKHYMTLLFGGGSYGYPFLSISFAPGTHNLLLDILMSWGIVGFLCFAIFICSIVSPHLFYNKLKHDLLVCLPFIVLFIFSLTALRTTSLKTFLYIFITLTIISDTPHLLTTNHDS